MLQTCDAVDKWLLVKSGIKVISKSWYDPSKGANYEHRLARYRAYTKAFNHVREEGIPLAPIQVDKFTKVDVINLQTRRTKRYKVQYT